MSNDHNRRDDRRDHPDHDHEDLTVVVNVDGDDDHKDQRVWFEQIIARQTYQILSFIEKELHDMSLDLSALKEAVARDATVDQSVRTLLTGISQQLTDLIASGSVDTAELQGVIDGINQNTDAMVAAVQEHTQDDAPVDGNTADPLPGEETSPPDGSSLPGE